MSSSLGKSASFNQVSLMHCLHQSVNQPSLIAKQWSELRTQHGGGSAIKAVKAEDALDIQAIVGSRHCGPQTQAAANLCASHIWVAHPRQQAVLLHTQHRVKHKISFASQTWNMPRMS